MKRALSGFLTAAILLAATGCQSSRTRTTGPQTMENAVISGASMSALALVYQDWKQHVGVHRYSISDQTVALSQTPRGIFITLLPRMDGSNGLGGQTRYGKEVYYVVDPSGTRITSRTFSE